MVRAQIVTSPKPVHPGDMLVAGDAVDGPISEIQGGDMKLKSKLDVKTFVLVAFVLLCAGLLQGCFGMKAAQLSASGSKSSREVAASDVLIAAGRLSESDSKRLGLSADIILVGEKATYLLTKGGEELLSISENLDGNRIFLFSETVTNSLNLKDKKFWGKVALGYSRTDPPGYSAVDVAALEKAGFQKGSYYYSRTINFEGVVLEKIDLTDAQKNNFKVRRPIGFYSSSGGMGMPNYLAAAVLVPLGFAADAVLWPLYMLFPAHSANLFFPDSFGDRNRSK
jgi:hypothetical protein